MNLSTTMLKRYLKTGNDRFLLRPFQFTVHSLPFDSFNLCSRNYLNKRRRNGLPLFIVRRKLECRALNRTELHDTAGTKLRTVRK